MNRRSFLKCIAALGAAIAVPIEVLADSAISDTSIWPTGVLREVIGYDIYQDLYLLRYDVLAGGLDGKLAYPGDLQANVFFEWSSKKEAKTFLPEQRKIARIILKDYLEKRGKKLSDLTPMQLPQGVHHAVNL